MCAFKMTKDYIAEAYPGARVRAGVLIFYRNRILMVREAVSGNFGPPKVLVDWSIDDSVAEAANRAQSEELDMKIDVERSSRVYVLYHPQYRELFVYYVVDVDTPPVVTARKRTITKIDWVGVHERRKYSRATRELIGALSTGT